MNEEIETTWEEYDRYMIETGQWLTENDYAAMIENMYNQGYADDEFAESDQYGC